MSAERCKQCGEMMTEQPAAYETVDLPGVPKHSDRFYEQWLFAGMGIEGIHFWAWPCARSCEGNKRDQRHHRPRLSLYTRTWKKCPWSLGSGAFSVYR